MLNFTDQQASSIFGSQIFSDIDDLFNEAPTSSKPSILSLFDNFIPKIDIPLEEFTEQAATTWLTKNKILEAIKQLLAIDLNAYDFEFIKTRLAKAAIPNYWAHYSFATEEVSYLHNPLQEDLGLIFDTETYVKAGNYPIIATAIGTSGVYLFIDDAFSGKKYAPGYIDLGNFPRLIVAHNASFDFQLIKQRFNFNNPVNAFCTMGAGRALYSIDSNNDWRLNASDLLSKKIQAELATRLSLKALYEFVVKKPLPDGLKEIRNTFVDASSFDEFIINKRALCEYAIEDTLLTLELFQHIYPKFKTWLKSNVCLQGYIQSADALLPVSNNFESYLDTNFKLANQVEFKIFRLLKPYVEELHQEYQSGWLDINTNIMLSKLDWRPLKPKNYRKKVLPVGWPKMTRWFGSFIGGQMSFSGNDLAYLLQLQWKGHDIIKSKKDGWTTVSGIKLPHPSGDEKANLGGLFAGPVKGYVEQDLLSSKVLDKVKLLELYTLIDSRLLIDSYGTRIKDIKLNK